MSAELYVKIDQHVKVNKKKVLLSDIAGIHCSNHDIEKEMARIMVLSITSGERGMYAVTFIRIVELIHRKNRDITVINEGEKDFIIEYVQPADEQVGKGLRPKRAAAEYLKAAFVCVTAFFGAAFTIMTFNMDVSVMDIFDKLYFWFTGIDKKGAPSILELSYCVGLPVGILVFFNHFSRRKLTVDPTPIHVEMRNYEKEIDNAVIEDAAREGKTIDVS